MRNLRWITFFCIALLSPALCWASPDKDIKTGNRLFNKGDFDGALKSYQKALGKDPNSSIIQYNIGSALYKKKEYPAAINYLRRSLLDAGKDLEAKSRYNLGLSLFEQGKVSASTDLKAAVEHVEEAVDHYGKFLKLKPKDADAKKNLKIFKEELERLKKLLEQQKKQEGRQKQDKNASEQDQDEGEPEKTGSRQDTPEQDGSQGENSQEEVPQNSPKEGFQNSENELNKKEQSGQQAAPREDQGSVSKEEKSAEEQRPAQSGSKDGKELTEQEAERFLEGYRQSEEPKGLLMMRVRPSQERPVEKDW